MAEINLNTLLSDMGKNGFTLQTPKMRTGLAREEAEQQFYFFFEKLLDKTMQGKGLPEYESVIDWLVDNQGKSLFLYGNNGRGKTHILTKVLPAIFFQNKYPYYLRCFNAIEIAENFDRIQGLKLFGIDDIGTEPTETNVWGTKRVYMNEIIDNMERDHKLGIFTSNLGPDELTQKYGMRFVDRLIGNCLCVFFGNENTPTGEDSFRRIKK